MVKSFCANLHFWAIKSGYDPHPYRFALHLEQCTFSTHIAQSLCAILCFCTQKTCYASEIFKVFQPEICFGNLFVCPRPTQQNLFFVLRLLHVRAEVFQIFIELSADACILCHFNNGAFVVLHLVHQSTNPVFPNLLAYRHRHEVKLFHAHF